MMHIYVYVYIFLQVCYCSVLQVLAGVQCLLLNGLWIYAKSIYFGARG